MFISECRYNYQVYKLLYAFGILQVFSGNSQTQSQLPFKELNNRTIFLALIQTASKYLGKRTNLSNTFLSVSMSMMNSSWTHLRTGVKGFGQHSAVTFDLINKFSHLSQSFLNNQQISVKAMATL